MTLPAAVIVPKVFLIDRSERGLPCPAIVAERSRHYLIRGDDPCIPALRGDAEHYADPDATDAPAWLRSAARGLLRALEAAR